MILRLNDLGNPLTNLLLFSSLSFGISVLLIALEHSLGRPGKFGRLAAGLVTCLVALASQMSGIYPLTLLVAGLNLALLLPSVRVARGLSPVGALMLAGNAETVLFGLAWALWFIATIHVDPVTRALMFAAYPLLALTTVTTIVQGVEQWESLIRLDWRRPRSARSHRFGPDAPLVSIHVPVHAEPPDVVIATLDSIRKLDYPNYEVLVIDNNTQEESLWRPVEAHCRALGPEFRFFHVDPLQGAKAGALNFALRHTDPEAQLVSIVDSDYQVESDFLSSMVPFFDDAQMGFVQTPHDYRDWQDNAFLRKCYWEYRYFFETNLVSQNERDAAIIVGTMCVIRKQALEEAGAWAEWCATEDSELAIRIHARGYSSVYLNQTFGRGLIPETFGDFKKQRHRWTVGPVQEFKRHWRLFLPTPFGAPSNLTPLQKLHHLNHGIENISMGLGFLTLVLGAAVMSSMALHHEVVAVPFVLWITATVALLTSFVHWALVYRTLSRAGLGETLGAFVTSKALTYVRGVASLQGLVQSSIAWRRTNKFKVSASGLHAVSQARAETVLGIGSLLFAALALEFVHEPGLLRMFAVGAVMQSAIFLAALYLAVLGDRELRAIGTAQPALPAVREPSSALLNDS